jgi:hypothetical protein
LLTPVKIQAGGYLVVSLSDGQSGVRRRKVHQLVAEAFLPYCPPPFAPLHGDGDPENNRLSNLRYGTPGANIEDARRHGTFRIGSQRSQAKLDEREASAIKGLPAERPSVLARAFGVAVASIQHIRRGANWPHVAPMGAADAQRELNRRKTGLAA